MDPELIAKLSKIAETQAPSGTPGWTVYGILVLVLIVLIIVLARGGSKILSQLLAAKDDMKSVIERVSTVVASNTAAQDRASEKHEIVLREVASLKDTIHQDRLQRAFSPKEKERLL